MGIFRNALTTIPIRSLTVQSPITTKTTSSMSASLPPLASAFDPLGFLVSDKSLDVLRLQPLFDTSHDLIKAVTALEDISR